jgi:anti-sigma factor RsiW
MNTAAIGRSSPSVETSIESSSPRNTASDDADEDEITEEDLANDPGIQKAVEALNNAKALYDEAMALPAPEPVTPEREAQLKRAFGTAEDRTNLIQVIRTTEIIKSLPQPSDMVSSVPPTMSHAVDVPSLLASASWLEQFARAWEKKGSAH